MSFEENRGVDGLRRYVVLAQAAGALLAAWGLFWIWLFFSSSPLAAPYRGQALPLVAGILFALLGALGPAALRRWSRRAIEIYGYVRPVDMRMSLRIERWSDSTDCRAELRPGTGSPPGGAAWRVGVFNPAWDATALTSGEVRAKVYFDPLSDRPAVIETEGGLLWVRGSVAELKDPQETR